MSKKNESLDLQTASGVELGPIGANPPPGLSPTSNTAVPTNGRKKRTRTIGNGSLVAQCMERTREARKIQRAIDAIRSASKWGMDEIMVAYNIRAKELDDGAKK